MSRFWLLAAAAFWMGMVPALAQEKRLQVLTSIPPLYSWAANVAGDRADVQNLLPPNVGPHDYQFRPRDLRKIQNADVIFLNGLGLESWFSRALTANDKGAAKKVVEVASGIATNQLIFDLPALRIESGAAGDPHHHEGAANPHLWLDPAFAQHAVSNLLVAMQQADPANAAVYAANAQAYVQRLQALDSELKTSLDQLKRRDIVTFHDAFPYFCRRYGLNLVGVIEEVPGASPSPRYLAELSRTIREKKVNAIFVEPQFEMRLARQLATDLGLGVAMLDTLETGRLDPGAYEEGMRANLRELQRTLK